jgi:hypothetical protein
MHSLIDGHAYLTLESTHIVTIIVLLLHVIYKSTLANKLGFLFLRYPTVGLTSNEFHKVIGAKLIIDA